MWLDKEGEKFVFILNGTNNGNLQLFRLKKKKRKKKSTSHSSAIEGTVSKREKGGEKCKKVRETMF
jgi:hypothetical protein